MRKHTFLNFACCYSVAVVINQCGGPWYKNGGCGVEREGDCQLQTADDCNLIISNTLTASTSRYSTRQRQTDCHPYVDCNATDRTATSTQTEPELTFGTVTVTVSDRVMDRQPASLVNSRSSASSIAGT
ncbi:hypothetical protein GGR51DRAFT_524525 [Nemania sp. FL0031]|nr:hypothetical protein GGR51DRAFT_524525 [Nemania sp. FL0031]